LNKANPNLGDNSVKLFLREPLDTKTAKKTKALPLDGLVNAWVD